MRWTQPGHELDEAYSGISREYGKKGLVIYGAGMVGGRIHDAVLGLTGLKVRAFFDRDESKTEHKGLPVYHPDQWGRYLRENEDAVVVMGLLDEEGRKVKGELVSSYGADAARCRLYSEFTMKALPVMALYQRGKVFLDTVSMIVTERCTLRCEKCSIMLPRLGEKRVHPLEKLKREGDALFGKADFIGNYTLTGGEPLTYEGLVPLISYLGDRHRDRMGSFKIITNGTITPSEELTAAMRRHDMAVEISDYTPGVPAIRDRVERTREAFERAGIRTYFLSPMSWVDFGFGHVDKRCGGSELRAFFDRCHTRCRGYVDGKIRYCVNAYFAERALGCGEDEANGFDIASMGDSMKERKKLAEFDLGYNQRGFLRMCRHCNGTVEINEHPVEVGRQCGGR